MNLKEYIASGILEAYALSDVSTKERQEVEDNLAKHPELRKELDEIERAMEFLLVKAGRVPGPGARLSILRSIEGSDTKRTVSIRSLPSPVWVYATAASTLIAVVSSVLAILFWNSWKRTETDLNERIALSQRVAEDYNTVQQRLDKIESDLQVYDHPAYRKVVLKGTAGSPEALATVYWNQSTRDVYLSLQNLKALAHDRQYQLWAIIDGQPVDMGVFDGDVTGLIKMKQASNASAFAVTIEPRGGRPSPTMESMQVLGTT